MGYIENWQFNEATLLGMGFFLAWIINLHGRLFRLLGDALKGKDRPCDVE